MNKYKLRIYLRYMLAAGLIFGIFFSAGSGLTKYFTGRAVQTAADVPEEEGFMERQDGVRTNILVLGVDARPGEESSRSDTMMLVSIDPKLDKAVIISIPRDTRAKVPGSPSDKIATANFIGGPELAVKTVEGLLDLKIDNYILMDFNGFKYIIDTLGGVTVTVPEKMYKPSEDINLMPGTQRLNGRQALGLVRYREYLLGDIQRAAQQQEFMKALADEILQPSTITKLPKLVKQLKEHVKTDLGVASMLRMVSWAPGFKADSLITQTLPGYFYDEFDENGNLIQSYWVADKGKTANLIDNLFAGKTVAVVSDSPLPPAPKKTAVKEDPSPEPDQNKAADLDIKRSQLPSVGHADSRSYPVGNINTGPEGYI